MPLRVHHDKRVMAIINIRASENRAQEISSVIMKVSFYGTRGSCPTPGAHTQKYGGNTACVFIESAQGKQLILDAGTGIRVLGDKLIADHQPLHLLISHNHYDHIQGFPFFKPVYQKGREINLYPAVTEPNQPRAIVEQLHSSYSPITPEMLTAELIFHSPNWPANTININGFKVSKQKINHPNGGMAYLIECDNQRVAYVTDNELEEPNAKISQDQWASFVAGVDLLIHDGQYIEADMPLKAGWGHSLILQSVQLAQKATVKRLAIYSHDPERSDEELDHWQAKINAMSLPFEVVLSQEGQTIDLSLSS